MKKYILATVLVTSVFAVSSSTAIASNHTSAELRQRVAQLQLQLNVLLLQAELANLQSAQSGREVSLNQLQRDLSVGMTGEDVRQLQRFLNQDSRTRVSISGPGSPGNETTTYGERTQQAVMQYKRIHNLQSEFVPLGRLDARTRSHMRLSLLPTPPPTSQPVIVRPPRETIVTCQNNRATATVGEITQSIYESGNTITVQGAAYRCTNAGTWETVRQTSSGAYELVQSGCAGIFDSRTYPIGSELTGTIDSLSGRATCQSSGWDIRLR